MGPVWGGLTLELLEHPVDGAGAAGAAHADVELVCVCVGHCDVCCEVSVDRLWNLAGKEVSLSEKRESCCLS